jgi:cation:H+ antiporter
VLVALLLGAAGIALVVWGAERLVKAVRARAAVVGLSALVIGLLATSVDLESTVAGIAAAHKGLDTVAVGISLGSVVFLATAALGIAALLFPFAVQTPPYFLGAMFASAASVALVLLDGRVGRVEAVGLIAVFAVMLAGTRRHARVPAGRDGPDKPEHGTTLVRTRTRFIVTVVTSLAVMSAGAELLADGARRAVAQAHQSETIVGMVVVAVALSLEEGLLELLPAYRGVPELAVGNVLGTTVFLLTVSLGAVGLVHPLQVRPEVVTFHLPAMLGAVGLAGWALTRPRTGRREGAVLVAYYCLYLVASWLLR